MQPNTCAWTYLILGYVENGYSEHAFNLFSKMQTTVHPNMFTLLTMLKACSQLLCLMSGRVIHSEVVNYQYETDLFICNSLLDMYAKCGSLTDAREVFDRLLEKDVVSWTALIAGYVDHGFDEIALICLDQMQAENVSPNAVTYFYCIKACINMEAIDKGRKLHMKMVRDGFGKDPLPAGMLMELYAKWGSIQRAHNVFDELPVKNTVLWTTLITAYTDQGFYEEAMACLKEMEAAHSSPDAITYVCALKVCGNLGVLEKGLELHSKTVKSGFDYDLILCSILMDMYVKCGQMAEIEKIFGRLPLRDVVAWTALLSGYAYQGQYDMVLYHFERMIEEGTEPNATTFLIIFTVCNHAGFAIGGLHHFRAMVEEFDIFPSIKHYNSMVDLLGRAGQLNGAADILDKMPFQPNIITWETVLGSCRIWGDVCLAKQAYECAEKLDGYHGGILVLMSNIYANNISE
ncbi:hypothetical protein KP509_10G069100 [Ceratopteris richardii]|nr:hypothetical protein KP509_10G069100 [Ceratopteris richardii]